MRCVLIGPTYPFRGGIAHYTTLLYQALVEQKHAVLFVSFRRQYPQRLFPGRSDRDPSIKPLQVDTAQYWLDSMNPLTWLTSFWRIRRYRPDALIMQWWTTFWAPVWLILGMLNRLFLRRPLVYICHNVLPHEPRWWDSLLTKMVLQWGASFVVQSEEEEKRLHNLLPLARTVIFPLPILDLWTKQSMPKEQAKKHLGLPADIPLLLFFGIVREYKGLQDLLAAMPMIKARLGPVHLLVAGEFWADSAPYLETIRRLDIEGEVQMEDRYIPNEQAIIYFSAADLLVAPYRHVTGSAVVQLARGMGLPVVTTRLGGLAEVAEGELGLLAPAADPEGLAATIIKYFEDGLEPKLRLRIHQRRDRNSWEQLVALLEASA